MTWRELSIQQFNRLQEPLLLDVRSPGEYECERIPSAINVPLLSDIERAEVGTVYKQQGEAAARLLALKLIAPNIPAIIDRILSIKKSGQTMVVHCWRGGLRSETVASFLSVIGMDCFRLTGGYKAWRRQVLDDFAAETYSFKAVVLHGLTGVGKTEILHKLKDRGHPVLDLEGLANHRGSVFGGMGLGKQPTQKNFEAAIWSALRQWNQEFVFIEAESRKIGKLALPDCILSGMSQGQKILVTSSIGVRTQRIVDAYAQEFDDNAKTNCISGLQSLKERLGSKRVQEVEEYATSGLLSKAVATLLLEYYDPLYIKQIERARPFALEVCSDNISQAVATINSWTKTNDLIQNSIA